MSQTHLLHLLFLPVASRFPLPHFTFAVFICLSPLPFSFAFCLFAVFLRRSLLPASLAFFLLVLVWDSPSMARPTTPNDTPENEVLNFRQNEEENLKDAWYRICNAQSRSTRKQSTTVLLRSFYVGISPWNRYILDTIIGRNFWGAILLTPMELS